MIEYDDKCSGRVIEIDKISNLNETIIHVISKHRKYRSRTERKYIYFLKDLIIFYQSNMYFINKN